MTKSKLAPEVQAELDEYNHRQNRSHGYSLMSIRDRGWQELTNGVIAHWNFPRRESEAITYRGSTYQTVENPRVPNGHFGLEVNGELVVFDAEELRKVLRWA